ncbi:NAD binding domain of 6-phosphogluconate dehydrogenase-domain-containing protein [Xylaria acuta]|nr:NAD binding domain of 6-phosphogluconate dehydrogenase-domain-containing protein [Xylaria acuta]
MAASAHSFGFIGLGNRCSQMTHNLTMYSQKQAYARVQIWNRSTAKSEQLAEDYYYVTHMCLASDDVAYTDVDEILAVQKQGIIIVDHSTLFPTTSWALQEKAARSGVLFCSCTVFGPPTAAKSAAFLTALTGQEEARNVSLLKILGSNCILGTIELLSESFTPAEGTGSDVNRFYDFIPETSTPTPVIDQAWNHLTSSNTLGGDSLDWSAYAAGMRVAAGLRPFKGEDYKITLLNSLRSQCTQGALPICTNGQCHRT